MDKPPKYPGFTALLPPRVRYDKELRSTAKLLYAEISAMADVTGFCWASNRYLGELFGVTKGRTKDISRSRCSGTSRTPSPSGGSI